MKPLISNKKYYLSFVVILQLLQIKSIISFSTRSASIILSTTRRTWKIKSRITSPFPADPIIAATSIPHRGLHTLLQMSSPPGFQITPKKDIIIAGAGIIGTSTAYYLAQNHAQDVSSITIIDPSGIIAPAASGKAGGFLALDWNDSSPIGPLTRRSFELHSILSKDLGASKIMYRRLTCTSISVRKDSPLSNGSLADIYKKPSGKKMQGVEWASDVNLLDISSMESMPGQGRIVGARSLGDESTIAQVHPKMLCDAMWEAVQGHPDINAKIVKGKVKRSMYGDDASFQGAELEDESIVEGDSLLFACGPWTEIGNCMVGVKYHSAVIPTKEVLSQSVFYDGFGDPEVYPRPDGTAYCCGFPDPPIRVTEEPGKEEVRQEKVDEIVEAVRAVSGGVSGILGSVPDIVQSCYLPTTPDNIPMMGHVEGQDSCFVAAGHGCWGILMGPASGEAMASLLVAGKSTKYVDLRLFRPERFSKI